jgi:hypothetical protein
MFRLIDDDFYEIIFLNIFLRLFLILTYKKQKAETLTYQKKKHLQTNKTPTLLIFQFHFSQFVQSQA